MATKFKTLTFPNTPKGQQQKVQALEKAAEEGWVVVSETLTQGETKGCQACCLAVIFWPLVFCAGSTDGEISITLKRDE